MKKNVIAGLIVMFFLSSCAVHNGFITGGSASLSSNNFKYVKLADGHANATKIFGIGGLGKQGLISAAKKNLLENYPLKDGQALANITVDFKNSIIFFVKRTRVTMTADIVEFK